MVTFYEGRFPITISYQSEGGPEFANEGVQTKSGAEEFNQLWEYPLHRFNALIDTRRKSEIDQALHFFWGVKGRYIPFRYKDWGDFKSDMQNDTPIPVQIGVGNGSDTEYQLVKPYLIGTPLEIDRIITKPRVQGTSNAPDTSSEQNEIDLEIYIDGVLKTLNSDYTINETTGIITFGSPPGVSLVITASFTFDVPVRFDTDFFPNVQVKYNVATVTLPFMEVRL